MAWLVEEAPRLALTWEVQRDHVLCRAEGLEPADLAVLVQATVQFARRVANSASD